MGAVCGRCTLILIVLVACRLDGALAFWFWWWLLISRLGLHMFRVMMVWCELDLIFLDGYLLFCFSFSGLV